MLYISGCCFSFVIMSGNFGLDHRSSLRKLAFPASCVETLRRLYHQVGSYDLRG